MNGRDDTDEVLAAVSAAVLAVTRHLSVAEVLEVIVRSARDLLHARYGALGVPDDDDGFAEFISDGISDKQREAIGPLPRQHGMLAALLREGETIRSRDIRTDERFGYFPKSHPVMTDFLGVPITDGADTVGIIFLAGKPGGFTSRDERLLTLFASHAAIAMANARLYERSRELTVMRERTRLARELHDAVTQKLFSLRLAAQTALTVADKDFATARTQLARVEEWAAEAMTELRGIIEQLRPAELSGGGLEEAVGRQLALTEQMYAVRAVLEADSDFTVDDAYAPEVLRIVQEAVHNAVRHAQPSVLTVRLRGEHPAAVEIIDDGTGFDPQSPGGGLGLTSMKERAAAMGGSLRIVETPGRGTTVRLVLP